MSPLELTPWTFSCVRTNSLSIFAICFKGFWKGFCKSRYLNILYRLNQLKIQWTSSNEGTPHNFWMPQILKFIFHSRIRIVKVFFPLLWLLTFWMGLVYKPFGTIQIWPSWQGGSGKVKICPKMAWIWLWSRPEAPKLVYDHCNGPKMVPPTAPDWFESISWPFKAFQPLYIKEISIILYCEKYVFLKC